jgi:hypothetical protein
VELLGDEESMKKRIDEGILVETETIDLIQWFWQKSDAGYVPWVRIERSGGRADIHICCGEPLPSEKAARDAAILRADQMNRLVLEG